MNDKDDPDGVRSIAVSGVVGASLLAALIQKLEAKGLLSPTDVRDIYDDALHTLECAQVDAAPEDVDMYEQARRIIEQPLRDTPLPDDKS